MARKVFDPLRVRAASYSRTSVGGHDADHLAVQQRTSRARAERDGLRIPPELEFHDSTAGTARNRPGLAAMRKAAAERGIAVLYVADVSRLTREPSVAAALLAELADALGVRVVFFDAV